MFVYAILILLPALGLIQQLDGVLAKLEQELFDDLDADKSGEITEAETDIYFLTYDTNKDGEISVAEFTTSGDKVDPAFKGHEAVLYGLFDLNGDKEVNKADIDAVFVLVDKNKDNKFDGIEFKEIFETVVPLVGYKSIFFAK